VKKYPLKRRDLIRLLEANGFRRERQHGDHWRYEGVLDGRTRKVDVDYGISDFFPDTHRPLGGILSQLGFLDDDRPIPHKIAWERLYAGSRETAKSAQVAFRPWNDGCWVEWWG
jgi:hypothetical protein